MSLRKEKTRVIIERKEIKRQENWELFSHYSQSGNYFSI